MGNATAVFEFLLIGISNYPEWKVTFSTLVLITYLLSTLLGNGLIIFLIHSDLTSTLQCISSLVTCLS